MWWEIVLIIAAISFAIFFVIIIVLIAGNTKHHNDNHKDSGGTQVGGNERFPFFSPRNERAGVWGEKLSNLHLRSLLKEGEYLLANVLLPLKNGHKTEIDCILITHKGIFCIETKKWVGHIIGNDDDEYWIQEYDDRRMESRQHRNPVKQNENHCAILERKLNNKYSVDNVVIFVGLEDGRGIDSQYAFTIREFKRYYCELNDDEINATDLKIIYNQLVPFVATPEELKKHREETRNRFN